MSIVWGVERIESIAVCVPKAEEDDLPNRWCSLCTNPIPERAGVHALARKRAECQSIGPNCDKQSLGI
ncbi:hypothetical protein RRSWK_00651 [Rhodopirellula sp. SWK7]|nr:hypothetical protein RRSWK_00651 [Rhodopirellula sp. SWK7]